jgi:hypothetical protein
MGPGDMGQIDYFPTAGTFSKVLVAELQSDISITRPRQYLQYLEL